MKENQKKCHSKPDLESHHKLLRNDEILNQVQDDEGRSGFTLIELLVVVLIIGILSAIAVPQYQKAVLKSRFSSLMPTTQAIRDGQEAYYLTNSKYADEIAKLDVNATNTDDMSIDVGDEEETPELSYVIASRPSINNNLIMYQKHSEKFADNVHCEALKDNAQAQWLCKDALHGQPIDGSINEDYDTYLLSGTLRDNDYFSKECEGSGEQACECGTIVGTCNDKTGNWEYGGDCPTPLADETVLCGSNRFSGKKTRKGNVCQGEEYTYGAWDERACKPAFTENEVYLQQAAIALDMAQQWAQEQDAFYKANGYYQAKKYQDFSWGTCYTQEGTPMAAYCTYNTPGTRDYIGGIGVVYGTISSEYAGKSYCWGQPTNTGAQVCKYLNSNYVNTSRNYFEE